MKTKILNTLLAGGLVVLGLASCAHPSSKDIDSKDSDSRDYNIDNDNSGLEETNSESTMLGADSDRDYATYASEIDTRFNQNTEALNEMTKKSQSGANAGQLEHNQELYELNRRNLEIQNKVKDHKNEGSESWDDFKESINNEMNELEKSIKTLGEKDS